MATVRKRGRPASLTDSTRKERKRQSDRERGKEKIFIGDQLERWNAVREELDMKFNHEVAGFLLDRYEAERDAQKEVHVASSTPRAGLKTTHLTGIPQGLSDISSGESGKQATDPIMSGVEELDESGPGPSTSKKAKGKFSSSFFDPLELSIDITEESEDEDDDDDDEYQPSFNISLGPKDVTGIEDCSGMEAVFPAEEEEEDEEDEVEDADLGGGPSITRVLHVDDIPDKVKTNVMTLVFLDQLIALANLKVTRVCQVEGCGEDVNIVVHHVGSALYLKWVCAKSHEAEKWCSQPLLNRGLHAGDLMISAAILFSGNNFRKMELFARFLKLRFPGQSTFTRLQNRYLVPAVDELWKAKQAEIMDELTDKNLIILGDGRMDSPGHCAQYCTYTCMEDNSK
ncbi:uncharacterized protein LOC134249458, partial [Saccostrea cucullata]|uniref:uncharacterized protein LOC134249458 n=1 Tax=Saccostrea cuccullata TaxID=36930 RepID=UPI002ED18461